MNDEILAIRAELDQLGTLRAKLFRRLNALQSSTRVLPPETLSLIFKHFFASCEPPTQYDPIYPPILLGSVSYAWRQVAWSTPQLWQRLRMSTTANDQSGKWSAGLLDLYLVNVDSLPITISINFDYYKSLPFTRDPIARILSKKRNLEKIVDLRLHFPPSSWLLYSNVPFPHLVNFTLSYDFRIPTPQELPFLSDTPALKELSFKNISVPPRALWPSITTLKLRNAFFAVVGYFLLGSPNLVEFLSEQIKTTEERGQHHTEALPRIPDTLTLHHLETLSWAFTHGPLSNLFLERIRLPKLRSLNWNQQGQDPAGRSSLGMKTFFQNLSSAPLTTLCLERLPSIDIAFVEHIYHQNPRIEHLIFYDCTEEALKNALAPLVPASGQSGFGEQPYLTKLKVIEFKGWVLDKKQTLELQDTIVDVLVGRISGGFDPSFCINIQSSPLETHRWSSNKKQRLKELKRAGASVQLLEFGKQVEVDRM